MKLIYKTFYIKRNSILSMLLLLLPLQSNADQKEIPRLSYWRHGVFYETGISVGSSHNSSLGNAFGIEFNVNPVYDGMEEDDAFNLGWTLNGSIGYNFTLKTLRPNNLNIGMWGGYLLSDQVEVGLQYSFLGIYGYQNWQHFGCHISPAIRIYNAQLVFGRAGEGAVIGCFKPKNGQKAQHFIEASYFITPKYVLGARYTKYSRGTVTSEYNTEYRLFFAFNLGETMSKKSK